MISRGSHRSQRPRVVLPAGRKREVHAPEKGDLDECARPPHVPRLHHVLPQQPRPPVAQHLPPPRDRREPRRKKDQGSLAREFRFAPNSVSSRQRG